MGRLLVWLLIGLLGWGIWRSRSRGNLPPGDGPSPRPPAPGPAAPPPAVEAMIACAHCGLRLPASEALRDAPGRPYCSAAHRDAGPPQ